MNISKQKNEKIQVYYERIRNEGLTTKDYYQGIRINDVEYVLKKINKYSIDIRDTIFCLLNNEFPSLFSNATNYTIADGASVAHIAGYIGILMRGGNPLDREGRDYWIKPLREIGAIEEITYDDGIFKPGHLVAKSPNSCYRLNISFVKLLQKVSDPNFDELLAHWISNDSVNIRLTIYLEAIEKSKQERGISSHKKLINDSIDIYAKYFLKGYIPIYIDAEDGDRISDSEKKLLEKFQIKFGSLDDVWPDVLMINEEKNELWFIEAVTSDGEVDEQKLIGLKRICQHSGKLFGGATTTYPDWKKYASRQQKEDNIALNTFVWIRESPGKQFKVL